MISRNHKFLFFLLLFGCSDNDPQPKTPLRELVFFGDTEILALPPTTENISNTYLDSAKAIVRETRKIIENIRDGQFLVHSNYERLDTLSYLVDSLNNDPHFEWLSFFRSDENGSNYYQVGRSGRTEYFWNLDPWFIPSTFSTINSAWQWDDKSEGYYSSWFFDEMGYLEWSRNNEELIITDWVQLDTKTIKINLSDNSGSVLIDKWLTSIPIEENLYIEWFADGSGIWKLLEETEGTILDSGSW